MAAVRFHVGQTGFIAPAVEWRVVQGKKAPDDLRLDIRSVRFAPVSMKLGFLFADFYAQNEQTLQRRGAIKIRPGVPAHDRYLAFIEGAMHMGWEDASDQLDLERQAA